MNKMYLFGGIVVILAIFGIYSSGVLQSVFPPGTYVCDQFDVDLVVVSDTSNSMDDNCHCADGSPSTNGYCGSFGLPYTLPCSILSMKEATRTLISALESNENNRIGLVEYGTKVKSSAPLGSSLLGSKVDDYEASGFTCISCGINEAMNIINDGWLCTSGNCNNDVKTILVMSDGEANRCLSGTLCTTQEASAEAVSKAAEAYNNYGIKTYTVAFGSLADTATMRDIANSGHGEMFVADDDSIESIYLEIGGIVTCLSCSDDGVCDPGENCQRCPNDCIPQAGQVCCDGAISTVECSIDSQCNDNDPCTSDTCDVASCGGVCIHNVKPGYKYDSFGVCHPPCSDGTVYGSCSATQKGYYCQ